MRLFNNNNIVLNIRAFERESNISWTQATFFGYVQTYRRHEIKLQTENKVNMGKCGHEYVSGCVLTTIRKSISRVAGFYLPRSICSINYDDHSFHTGYKAY